MIPGTSDCLPWLLRDYFDWPLYNCSVCCALLWYPVHLIAYLDYFATILVNLYTRYVKGTYVDHWSVTTKNRLYKKLALYVGWRIRTDTGCTADVVGWKERFNVKTINTTTATTAATTTAAIFSLQGFFIVPPFFLFFLILVQQAQRWVCVIRLSLGRRLVNLLPVAQRTNAFTHVGMPPMFPGLFFHVF